MDRKTRFVYISTRSALIFPVLIIVFLSLGCITPSIPSEKGVYIPEDAYGVAHAGEKVHEYQFLERVGAQWVRQTFRWDNINPEENEWNFRRFDHLMKLADQHDKKVIAVLAYDVGWIHSEGKARRHIDRNQLKHYLEYVRRTVTRYKGRVDAWEIWNEPNVIFWKGPDRDFYALSAQTAALIKSIDPHTPLLIGATFRVPGRFIQGLIDNGTLEKADALSIHPYGLNPEAAARLIEKACRIVHQTYPKKQIWVTEVGYPTRGLYPTKAGGKTFPPYVIKTLTAAVTRGVRVTIWYRHFDKPTDSTFQKLCDSSRAFGLADASGQLKDGGRAFALFAQHTTGTNFDPNGVCSPASIQSALFRKNNEDAFLVVWLRNGDSETAMIELSPSADLARHHPIEIIELHPETGSTTKCGTKWKDNLTHMPRLFVIKNLGPSRIKIST